MSKNRYLYEDIREAYARLALAMVETCKPLLVWLLDKLNGWIRLWERFTAWLYYLRHPCTIITMDEAPAKGVNVNFTYTDEYPITVEDKEALNKAMRPLDCTVKLHGRIAGEEIAKHINADISDMTERTKRINTFVGTLLECSEHNRKLKESIEDHANQEDWSYKEGCICHKCQAFSWDHVEGCLEDLHTSIRFLYPKEAYLGDVGIESQMKIVNSVKEDFKNLSEAIEALKKGQ